MHLYAPNLNVVSTQLIKKNCLAGYITVRLGVYKTRILLRSAHFCKETVHNVFFALALDELHSLAMHHYIFFRVSLPSAIASPEG